jgi:single-strand DNA-binding protein
MEVIGIIKAKFDTTVVSERFRKRDFVLTVEPGSPYPQHVSFQLVQDKVSLVDNFAIGEEVKVLFNLKGREWVSPQGETKYFNTIDAWRIEKVGSGHSSAPSQSSSSNNSQPTSMETGAPPVFTSNSVDDDLPF